ncbi:hypothetical protein BAE44_0025916 [Dichanthelium oligosanthes]|uniref:Rx N-terminal domain-containing protein n=1 Tax=Dichanthelium oligosanthes TaxID=888268 RepID=A0A1E5UJK4_9POAL|nr:hypothetical protein BAE44_0025916 [Dichanthelium oligosanthes]
MEKKDLLLKVWVEQVRDLSYDIEDCLDELMVHVGSQSLLQRLMKLKVRHRIADQIRRLKSRVEEVSNRNTRYRDSFLEDIRNLSGTNIDETEPWPSSGDMGGLGKTTLVRKVYETKEDIAKNFPYNAWITVSQSFIKTELLKDMIRKLLGDSH